MLKVIRDCFTLFCYWSRKLASLSQPISYKTNTNHDLIPCTHWAVWMVLSDFSLALTGISLSSNWLLWLHWFWFNDTQLKTALNQLLLCQSSNINEFVNFTINSIYFVFSLYKDPLIQNQTQSPSSEWNALNEAVAMQMKLSCPQLDRTV